VDVLLYDDLEVRERDLEIPHPRLVGRRFALEPLLLVWPDARLPDGRSLEELLPDVAGQRLRPVTGGWADGRWMASLEEALALDGDGPAYRAVAHPDWQNTLGRLFGGVQAGLALRAAGRARPDLDPAAISWGFLAPVPGGAELDVAVERERDRARAASIRVRLLVGAEVAGSGRVRMAATRPGPALGPPRPAVLSRAACRRLDELLASWGVDGPAIRNWQIRERWDVPSLDPARPDSPFRAWSQAMAVAPDDPALAAAAAVLPIDAFGWPAVHVALGELGDPTLPTTPTVELFAAFHPPPPEGLWQLAEATLTGIAGGRAATGVTVWDPDTGRVVAAGAVTMLLGPGRVPAR
ncbi:MAG TPA: hypothetical protein ENK55_09670, partial [Actinobacteria bacterium]|nr:hypothetical protein [Actinomycetota bacterium]